MMATFNSAARRLAQWKFVAIFLIFTAGSVLADETQTKIFAARAAEKFQQAEARLKSEPDNSTNLWQFARACFNLAEFSTNDTQRAALAQQGIATARQLIKHDSESMPGHYYLAMNLGQLARTQLFGALKLVREMEREFKRAADLDARFDYAGPERSLGLLYRDAPGWPTSIGSKRKARSYLEQAIKLAPDYPGNHLNLIESYIQWNERDNAKSELDVLDSLWPQARTKLSGETWESDWADWSQRREAAVKKLDEAAAPAPKMGR